MIMGTAALRAGNEKIEPSWVRLVQGQVEAMRFGVVQIVVHDSRVVQIERTEKLRLDKSESQVNFPGASARGTFSTGLFLRLKRPLSTMRPEKISLPTR